MLVLNSDGNHIPSSKHQYVPCYKLINTVLYVHYTSLFAQISITDKGFILKMIVWSIMIIQSNVHQS